MLTIITDWIRIFSRFNYKHCRCRGYRWDHSVSYCVYFLQSPGQLTPQNVIVFPPLSQSPRRESLLQDSHTIQGGEHYELCSMNWGECCATNKQCRLAPHLYSVRHPKQQLPHEANEFGSNPVLEDFARSLRSCTVRYSVAVCDAFASCDERTNRWWFCGTLNKSPKQICTWSSFGLQR